jgi:hypothetical protein
VTGSSKNITPNWLNATSECAKRRREVGTNDRAQRAREAGVENAEFYVAPTRPEMCPDVPECCPVNCHVSPSHTSLSLFTAEN